MTFGHCIKTSHPEANNMKTLSILLTVLFVGLKLTNYIDWSWGWVLSPIIAWISIVVILFFLLGICAFIGRKF